MGNADSEATQKHLKEENFQPNRSVGSIASENETHPAYFEYAILDSLVDTNLVAGELMDDRMRAFLKEKGYTIIEPGSEEFLTYLRELQRTMKLEAGTAFRIDIGTPIMVERGDESEPLRKINLIIGLVKKQSEKYGLQEYLIAHPVDIPETKVPEPSGQTRKDTGEFQPPLWYIQKEHPFGYRGMFPHIVSYPPKSALK